jgi:hypothetical protein
MSDRIIENESSDTEGNRSLNGLRENYYPLVRPSCRGRCSRVLDSEGFKIRRL